MRLIVEYISRCFDSFGLQEITLPIYRMDTLVRAFLDLQKRKYSYLCVCNFFFQCDVNFFCHIPSVFSRSKNTTNAFTYENNCLLHIKK